VWLEDPQQQVTWVDDIIFLVEADPRAPPFPLGPLDLQVALLDGEQRDALVVRSVELRQVLQSVTWRAHTHTHTHNTHFEMLAEVSQARCGCLRGI